MSTLFESTRVETPKADLERLNILGLLISNNLNFCQVATDKKCKFSSDSDVITAIFHFSHCTSKKAYSFSHLKTWFIPVAVP